VCIPLCLSGVSVSGIVSTTTKHIHIYSLSHKCYLGLAVVFICGTIRSGDYGKTWGSQVIIGPAHWSGVSVSGDGTIFQAVRSGDSTSGIFMGTSNPDPPIGVIVAAAAAAGIGAGVGIGR